MLSKLVRQPDSVSAGLPDWAWTQTSNVSRIFHSRGASWLSVISSCYEPPVCVSPIHHYLMILRPFYWNPAFVRVLELLLSSLQVNHRHAERRALVAEACGALAPYVASEMRPSLILSILQQMSTDADAIVRRAVVHSLTHLLPLLPDLDKFQAVSICCFDSVNARPRLVVSLDTCLELINLHLSAKGFHSSLHVCTLHASAKVQYMKGTELSGAHELAML